MVAKRPTLQGWGREEPAGQDLLCSPVKPSQVWKIGTLEAHGIERFVSFSGLVPGQAKLLGSITVVTELGAEVNNFEAQVTQAEGQSFWSSANC